MQARLLSEKQNPKTSEAGALREAPASISPTPVEKDYPVTGTTYMHVSEENRNACDASSAAQNSFGNCSDFEPRREEGGGDACGMLCIPPSLLRGKSGLSRVDLALLAYIIENPEKQGSRTEIAEDCQCAANSVPRSAKKLEALGWIERAPGGGAQHTAYKLGRNLQVTTRNMEVTRNAEVTADRASDDITRNVQVTLLHLVPSEPKQTATDGVVTSLRGVVTSPPRPPYKNITLTLEDNLQTPEGDGDRGLGKEEGFALDGDEPKKPKRPSRAKIRYRATEASLPSEPTAKMLAHAAKSGFVNGTVAAMFAKWRDHHISRATEIADCEASWRTWVANAVEFRKRDADKATPGLRKRTAPDGSVYYDKDHSRNFYK